jgi:hypothetical protein
MTLTTGGLGRRGGLLSSRGLGRRRSSAIVAPSEALPSLDGVTIVIEGRAPWGTRRKRRDEALLLGHRWDL